MSFEGGQPKFGCRETKEKGSWESWTVVVVFSKQQNFAGGRGVVDEN